MSPARLRLVLALVVLVAAALVLARAPWRQDDAATGFASGNGRIEATEIDIATKLPGRLEAVLVGEGDFVKAGQPLARMQVQTLQAQRSEALAYLAQAQQAVAGAHAQVALRESDLQSARALVTQRESDLKAATQRLERTEKLAAQGVLSRQQLDDGRAAVDSLRAALTATRAQVGSAQAAVTAARSQVSAAESAVKAAEATATRIDAELADSVLVAPRDGRVQYLVAQPGEVLGAGGKVLNLIDVSDVYMNFFLPETVAGRVAIGAEVRLLLDAAPEYAIPARVSFVASNAQFTPKTVETASERQKLMFRVKAQVDRALLQKHLQQVKAGLPGVAWVRLQPDAPWPAAVAGKKVP